MRAIALDYQRTPTATSRVGWSVLAAGLLLAALTVYTFIDIQRQLDTLEYRLARAERKPGAVLRGSLSAQDEKRYADEIRFANSVAERLTLPWEDLMQAIESAGNADVALLSLQPDVTRGLLRITAEAKNKSEMLAYLGRLGADTRIANVHLLDHQLRAQDAGQPLRFTLQASWRIKTP